MIRRLVRIPLLALAIATGLPGLAGALPLQLDSVLLTLDGTSIRFAMTVDRMPELLVADEYGRQADAFQFTLSHDMESDVAYAFRDVWIQGVDIYRSGLVEVYPMQRDGYFGPLAAGVPYSILPVFGTSLYELAFSVPFHALDAPHSRLPLDGAGDAEQGAFRWWVSTFRYGGGPYSDATSASGQFPASVPEPSGLLLVGLGIAGSACLRRYLPTGRRSRSD
jgi:hypothetical protein